VSGEVKDALTVTYDPFRIGL